MTDTATRSTEVSDVASAGLLDGAEQGGRVALGQRRWVDAAMVAALVVVSLLERLPQLATGYWGDEVTCIGIAAHPLTQLPHYLRLDAAPPLYYVILHGWMQLFGQSPVATHSLSLLFGLLCIPAAWWMGDACFGRPAARGASALVASLPYLTYYSSETRMYGLLGLLAILAAGFFTRMVRDGGRRWLIGSAVCAAAVLYSHDWGIYLVAAEILLGLGLARRRRDRRLARQVVILTAGVAFLYLPWLPSFWFQLHHTGAPWSAAPPLAGLVLAPLQAAGQTFWFLVLVALLAAVMPLSRAGAIHSCERGPSLRITALLCCGMVVLAWAGAQIVRSWDLRYLGVAAVPLMVVLAARLVQSRGGRVVLALLVVTLLATSLPIDRSADAELVSKSNAAALLPPLRAQLRPGDLVITEDQGLIALTSFYLRSPEVRFAGPYGTVARPSVWDGTDPVRRMEQADPETEVAALTRGLPAGSHVLFVGYPRYMTDPSTGTSYNRRFNAMELQMAQAVAGSPRLRLVHRGSPNEGVQTGVPMEADLYVVS